ncbi:MAG: hypothetical protein ACI8XG_000337 [Congregibacter sp.]|jgi:uncharacterized protein YlxP (DUF503 family)
MLRKHAAMARKRTEMRKVKDVLRLKFEVGLSHRDVGKCLNLGLATVSNFRTKPKSDGKKCRS